MKPRMSVTMESLSCHQEQFLVFRRGSRHHDDGELIGMMPCPPDQMGLLMAVVISTIEIITSMVTGKPVTGLRTSSLMAQSSVDGGRRKKASRRIKPNRTGTIGTLMLDTGFTQAECQPVNIPRAPLIRGHVVDNHPIRSRSRAGTA